MDGLSAEPITSAETVPFVELKSCRYGEDGDNSSSYKLMIFCHFQNICDAFLNFILPSKRRKHPYAELQIIYNGCSGSIPPCYYRCSGSIPPCYSRCDSVERSRGKDPIDFVGQMGGSFFLNPPSLFSTPSLPSLIQL